jgi:hypothetical protein
MGRPWNRKFVGSGNDWETYNGRIRGTPHLGKWTFAAWSRPIWRPTDARRAVLHHLGRPNNNSGAPDGSSNQDPRVHRRVAQSIPGAETSTQRVTVPQPTRRRTATERDRSIQCGSQQPISYAQPLERPRDGWAALGGSGPSMASRGQWRNPRSAVSLTTAPPGDVSSAARGGSPIPRSLLYAQPHTKDRRGKSAPNTRAGSAPSTRSSTVA